LGWVRTSDGLSSGCAEVAALLPTNINAGGPHALSTPVVGIGEYWIAAAAGGGGGGGAVARAAW